MSSHRRGIVLGVAAYLAWGLFPLYWPLLEPAGAIEILAHRVVWSLAVAGTLLLVVRRAASGLPRDRRRLLLLAAAAIVIAVNWAVYIWGVNHKHVVDTSLGYFVTPLVSVALGVLVLGERLRLLQWVAVAIAAGGVLDLTIDAGHPPWIALTLALSFATYGLIKKIVGVGPVPGLVVETALLTPLALAYLVGLGATGRGNFTGYGPGHVLLLVGAGPVTALPLLAFAGAAAAVPLSQLGLLQYLTPTMQFLVGVFVRHEPLSAARLAGFGLVWIALGLLTADIASRRHRRQPSVVAEVPSVA